MDITFHYPPDLFDLMVRAIPALVRSKRDLLLFFRGAGIPDAMFQDISEKVRIDRDSIYKHEIARTILERLNKKGESGLGERRELLRRVCDYSDFSSCYPNTMAEARGLVAQIRELVKAKDTLTRIVQERDREREERIRENQKRIDAERKKLARIEDVKSRLFPLFASNIPKVERGKELELALTELFEIHGVLVKEPFCVKSDESNRLIEQVDGAIELKGELYILEIKWTGKRIDKKELSDFLVSVYHRGHARGIFVSSSGYTEAAILSGREALQRTVVVLLELSDIVKIIEDRTDLAERLNERVTDAVLYKRSHFN